MEQKLTEPMQKALNQITQKDSDSEDFYCAYCEAEIELTPSAKERYRNYRHILKCLECQRKELEKFNADEEARVQARRLVGMAAIPPTFRSIDRDKLPQPDKFDEAMKWQYGPKGLLLHGKTGCGKTRILWELAKREINFGRKVRNLSVYELTKYPAMVAAGDRSAIKFSDSLVEVDLLILDDVFKAKPTERIEELLFAVVDERGAWERPCLVSLNDTGDTLKERLSTDRGPALIRRFRDYCIPIQF